jgi:hypothetical protein
MSILGINYPWTVLDGKPNYGCDFGRNIWGSRAGVAMHEADVRADFETMATMGVQVARWFVFTDGRGGVEWDGHGRVVGLADGFFDDLDTALGIARDTNVRVCLVLFDFTWMMHGEELDAAFQTQPDALRTVDGAASIFTHIIDPLLARYGTHGPEAELGRAIHSFDVINEPDWVTRGLALNHSRIQGSLRPLVRPFSREELRYFVRGVADRVHSTSESLVTVGGGRAKFAAEWDKPVYGLDFVQVHLYPDAEHPGRDRDIVGKPCRDLGVWKRVLIGECPAHADREHPPSHTPMPYVLADYLAMARTGGYLGVWPWSFRGVDEFGAVTPDQYRDALATHT